jgi:threonine aldolase
MKVIDLRSDTVTQPSPEMRQAMFEAELGDDVYVEDPTVNRLEGVAAERLGKEAGLMTVSGTMSNLLALLSHCGRGDEVIMGDQAHTFRYEVGGPAALASLTTWTVPNQRDGTLRLEDVAGAIRGDDIHNPRTRLIVIENTHNRMGGVVLSPAYIDELGDLARRNGLKMHMDGARLFNASVALSVDPSVLTRSVDSVCFCLSKGLACPVGSVLCGSKDFVATARRYRKMLGGGWRQAGVLAAAGLVALDKMVDRLADDHRTARRLAEGLAALPAYAVDMESVQTNIVMFELKAARLEPAAFQAAMKARGVLFNSSGPRRFRLVTHYGFEMADVDAALAALRDVVA